MTPRTRLLGLLYLAVVVASLFVTGCKSGSNNPLTNPLNFKPL